MSGFLFFGCFLDVTNTDPDKKSSQKLLQTLRSMLCEEKFQV